MENFELSQTDIDTMKQEILDRVASRFTLKDTTLTYSQSADDIMDNLVWTKIMPNINTPNPLAFATRSGGLKGVFEIYVNPLIDEEVAKYLELHEKGHIIFTHMSMQEKQREIQIAKILQYWGKIKTHLDLSDAIEKAAEKGISEDKIAKKYAKMLANKMLNIAMDFEVNSKLFTKDEWEQFKEYTDYAYFYAAASMDKTNPMELAQILKFLQENESKLDERFTKPCWPEDYEFPLKLTFGEYIDLMCKNIDKFMDKMADQNGSGDGDESDGDGDGESEDGDGSGSNGGHKKMSAEDIEKMQKEADDGDNEKNQDRAENGDEAGGSGDGEDGEKKEKGSSSGSGDEQGESEVQKARSAGAKRGGKGYSPVGHKKDGTVYIEGANNKAVEDFIIKNVFNKKVENTRVDYMKLYNRRKYGNVMVSTANKEDVWRPGNIYMIVDCSGSIQEEAIKSFITTVKNVAKKCGPKSRIIWWDTDLEGDTLLRENKGPEGCGGTRIATGIKYVREKYLGKNKNDKLIIISDYYDALYQWNEELQKTKNDCVGICWTSDKVESGDEYLRRCCWSDRDGETISQLQKKLKTIFVNIDA